MIINIKKSVNFLLHAYEKYLIEDTDKSVDWFHNDVADGFTTVENNIMYIVFRGTDDEDDDSAVNYRYTKTRVPYNGTRDAIRVHNGFIDVYDTPEVREELHKRISKFIEENERPYIHITGHSQGGALAILCALDVQYNFGKKLQGLINLPFAPPRVGNQAFANSYNHRVPHTYCLWLGFDIVPKVPLWTMGFRHVGKRIIMQPRNIFHIIGNFFAGLFRMIKNKRKPIYSKYEKKPVKGSDWLMFDDHSPHHYPTFGFNAEFLKDNGVTRISKKQIEKGYV